jgi:hypothetical protein
MLSYNKRLTIVSIFTIALIFAFFYMAKQEQNNQFKKLWITSNEAQGVKNEINSIENKNKSDSLSDEEISFFENNWLKKDPNGLYYMYDKYQLESKMIYFKKEDSKWKWSILLWDWDNLDDNKYDNPNSIYNWYIIKQDKTKEIFEKLKEFSK